MYSHADGLVQILVKGKEHVAWKAYAINSFFILLMKFRSETKLPFRDENCIIIFFLSMCSKNFLSEGTIFTKLRN